jgi:hypothetical protein
LGYRLRFLRNSSIGVDKEEDTETPIVNQLVVEEGGVKARVIILVKEFLFRRMDTELNQTTKLK